MRRFTAPSPDGDPREVQAARGRLAMLTRRAELGLQKMAVPDDFVCPITQERIRPVDARVLIWVNGALKRVQFTQLWSVALVRC